MALLTTISETNRIDEQGGVWNIQIRPVDTKKVTVESVESWRYQWKADISFTKSYRYVGLDKASALSLADTIREKYTFKPGRKVVRWDKIEGHWDYKTVSISADGITADVTPWPMEGPMWQIAVSVNATLEKFFTWSNDAPTLDECKDEFDGIDDYPELQPDDPEPETM